MDETPLHPDLHRPEYFLNRELSWLEFNYRVLEEAMDPLQPLLERVRFLSIFGTNLDEFFEVRMAGLKQQIESKSGIVGADHLTAAEIFAAATKRANWSRCNTAAGTKTCSRRCNAKTSSSRMSKPCRRRRRRGQRLFFARNSFRF